MIKKVKSTEQKGLEIEVPERDDALNYVKKCILYGIEPVDFDLCNIADAELEYRQNKNCMLEQIAIEIGEEYELQQQEIEIKKSPDILKFLEEAKRISINEIGHSKEKKDLLKKYFLKFRIDGIQPINIKEKTPKEHPLKSIQEISQQWETAKIYNDVEIRDLFRNVVISYRKKYDLILAKKEMPIFLQESSIFIGSKPWEYGQEKQEILEKYFPEEIEPSKKYDSYEISTILKIKTNFIKKLNLLEHNTLENRT